MEEGNQGQGQRVLRDTAQVPSEVLPTPTRADSVVIRRAECRTAQPDIDVSARESLLYLHCYSAYIDIVGMTQNPFVMLTEQGQRVVNPPAPSELNPAPQHPIFNRYRLTKNSPSLFERMDHGVPTEAKFIICTSHAQLIFYVAVDTAQSVQDMFGAWRAEGFISNVDIEFHLSEAAPVGRSL